MESKQKHFIGLTVAFAVIGVALLVTAFATDHWVTANPRREDNSTTLDQITNTGNSSFGLFNGQQSLKYQTGVRDHSLLVVCDPSEAVCAYIFMRPGVSARANLTHLISLYQHQQKSNSSDYEQIDYGLFSFPLWVTTIVALSMSIVMGLVTIGFSIFNVFGRPIETITGPFGLYVWNGAALLFTCLTLALFGALYGLQLSKNFLMFEDYSTNWRNEGHTDLDFSFFLIVGAAGAFIVNFILLCLSGQSLSCSYAGSGEKEVDNGMILY